MERMILIQVIGNPYLDRTDKGEVMSSREIWYPDLSLA
jgi:hypothetical protein